MASEMISRALGAADNVYSFVPKPSSLRFFSHGWGDLGKARASRHKMGECIEGREYERAAAEIPLPAGAGDGSFPSPWAEYLPAESADVPFRLLLPANGAAPRAIVIVCPGTGDQTFAYREYMFAQPLLDAAGVGVLLLMPPHVGSRKPAAQSLHYVNTVEQYLIQSGASQIECLTALAWAQRAFPEALLGIAGLSWGGAMAACVGALWEGPVAITALLSTVNAEPLISGLLQADVAWEVLKEPEWAQLGAGATGNRLRTIFEEFSFEHLVRAVELGVALNVPRAMRMAGDSAAPKVAVHAVAKHDKFVAYSGQLGLYECVRRLGVDARLVHVPGGHASNHALARWTLAHLVGESVEQLEKRVRPSARL